MGDVSKRPQPDKRTENRQRAPMGVQHSKKIPPSIMINMAKTSYTRGWKTFIF